MSSAEQPTSPTPGWRQVKLRKQRATHGPTTSSTAPSTLFHTIFQPSCNSHQLNVRYLRSRSLRSSSGVGGRTFAA